MDIRGAQRKFLGTSKIFACPANPAIPPWYLDFWITLATTFEHTDRCILGVLSENSRHLENPIVNTHSIFVNLDHCQACFHHESSTWTNSKSAPNTSRESRVCFGGSAAWAKPQESAQGPVPARRVEPCMTKTS